MADTTRRTTFRLLLKELRALIINETGLAAGHVFVRMRAPRFQTNIASQTFVILRPGNAEVTWNDSPGSEGRLAAATERVLIVQPFLQMSMDTVRSEDRLADAFLQLEDQLIDILDIYEPEDTLEPLHYLGTEMETSGQEVDVESPTPNWATSQLHFSVKFNQAVNQGLQ